MKAKVLVGTSGYSYKHWKDVFYPSALTQNKWFQFYTKTFKAVELNVTFYRLPSRKTFQGWFEKSPKNFKFVIKGSRYITHIKRLKGCKESLKLFFGNASGLENKLICVLWQLPPSFKYDLKRLEKFIDLLKKYPKCFHSMEFRHQTWFNNDTYDILKGNNINLCIADSPNFPSYEVITSNFLYLRFHGGKTLYGSQYSEKELKAWAQKTKKWLKGKKLLLAFFNNDAHGFAVKNALQFKKILR